jgi:hypothetical protein
MYKNLESKVKVLSPTPPARPRRFPRRDIAGAAGWQISANGAAHKHRKPQPTEHEEFPQFPTLDVGKDYKGCLLPASDRKGLLLLDEIVCFAFNGLPSVPEFLLPYQGHLRMGHMLWWSHVIHHDGDAWNCAADNLEWSADDELLQHTIRSIMWPDCLVKENWRRGKTRASGGKKSSNEAETIYVNAPHLPGWLPVNNEGKRIA